MSQVTEFLERAVIPVLAVTVIVLFMCGALE